MLVRTCMILLIFRAGGERDEGLYRNFCHLFCVVCKPTSPLLTSFLLFVEIDGFFYPFLLCVEFLIEVQRMFQLTLAK